METGEYFMNIKDFDKYFMNSEQFGMKIGAKNGEVGMGSKGAQLRAACFAVPLLRDFLSCRENNGERRSKFFAATFTSFFIFLPKIYW